MANARIEWIQVDNVSIRKAARLCGIDIEEIDSYPDPSLQAPSAKDPCRSYRPIEELLVLQL